MSIARLKRKRLLYVLPAAAISVGGFALAYSQSNRAPTSPAVDTTQVVAASGSMEASTKLADADLKFLSLPTAVANPTTYFTSKSQIVGRYLAVKVPAGAPIVATMIIADSTAGGVVHNQPLDIKAGDVALSIPFDEAKGIGGYVQPEDHLDILIAADGGIRYGIQDVRVLRIGGQAEAQAPPVAGAVPSVLVVEMPRDQAAVLTFLSSTTSPTNAVVKYVLRPHDAYGTGTIKGPDVNATNWSQFLAS